MARPAAITGAAGVRALLRLRRAGRGALALAVVFVALVAPHAFGDLFGDEWLGLCWVGVECGEGITRLALLAGSLGLFAVHARHALVDAVVAAGRPVVDRLREWRDRIRRMRRDLESERARLERDLERLRAAQAQAEPPAARQVRR